MNLHRVMVVLAMSLVFSTACTKMKPAPSSTPAAQPQYDVAKYQTANGSYTGPVKAVNSGKILGFMRVTIETVALSGQVNTQPEMRSSIEFLSATNQHLTTVTSQTQYDPSSGSFKTEIKVPSGTESQLIVLAAKLSGKGRLEGTLEAENYRGYGAEFTLERKGASLADLSKDSSSEIEAGFAGIKLTGLTEFSGGMSAPVNVSLNQATMSPEEELLSLLLPVKSVVIEYDYGNGAVLSFADGVLNDVTKTLTGSTQLSGNGSTDMAPVKVELKCLLEQKGNSIECVQHINRSAAVAARTVLRPVSLETPAAVFKSEREKVVRTYTGQGEFQPGKWTTVSLSVSFSAKSRLQEVTELYVPSSQKAVEASLVRGDSGVGAMFVSASWDRINSSLEASQMTTVNGNPVTLTLTCEGFQFVETQTGFSCDFFSSLRNVHVPIKF